MNSPSTFAEISEEFRVSFGYIRQDMKAVAKGTETVNYTLALLVGCACEMLAAARGDRKHPEKILAEVADPQWQPLAGALFEAIRNGLAHGFDTKHIIVDDVPHQIYMQWPERFPFRLFRTSDKAELIIGPRPLAALICQKIDELEDLLKRDARARAIWYHKAHRHKREIRLGAAELAAWKKLV
jgi:hypothetical protein